MLICSEVHPTTIQETKKRIKLELHHIIYSKDLRDKVKNVTWDFANQLSKFKIPHWNCRKMEAFCYTTNKRERVRKKKTCNGSNHIMSFFFSLGLKTQWWVFEEPIFSPFSFFLWLYQEKHTHTHKLMSFKILIVLVLTKAYYSYYKKTHILMCF